MIPTKRKASRRRDGRRRKGRSSGFRWPIPSLPSIVPAEPAPAKPKNNNQYLGVNEGYSVLPKQAEITALREHLKQTYTENGGVVPMGVFVPSWVLSQGFFIKPKLEAMDKLIKQGYKLVFKHIDIVGQFDFTECTVFNWLKSHVVAGNIFIINVFNNDILPPHYALQPLLLQCSVKACELGLTCVDSDHSVSDEDRIHLKVDDNTTVPYGDLFFMSWGHDEEIRNYIRESMWHRMFDKTAASLGCPYLLRNDYEVLPIT